MTLDLTLLLENPPVTAKRRYTEQELRKRILNYSKSKYDAMELVQNINTAIDNERMFCEDIEQLENNVGSNIGILISEMREKDF